MHLNDGKAGGANLSPRSHSTSCRNYGHMHDCTTGNWASNCSVWITALNPTFGNESGHRREPWHWDFWGTSFQVNSPSVCGRGTRTPKRNQLNLKIKRCPVKNKINRKSSTGLIIFSQSEEGCLFCTAPPTWERNVFVCIKVILISWTEFHRVLIYNMPHSPVHTSTFSF